MAEKTRPDDLIVYQIDVQGTIDEDWSDWLSGLTITYKDGVTTLTGPIADQAALRGILNKLWDLNLTLLSVSRGGAR